MSVFKKSAIALAVVAATSAASAIPASAGATLNGGGSSFMANMVDICSALYNKNTQYNTNGDVVSYSSVGSGTGKTNFANGTFKFGGTDSLYSSGAPSNFVYVPLISGAISVMYRLDGVTPANETVRLSPDTIGKIFAGSIKTWNDPTIVAENTAKETPAVKTAKRSGVTTTIKKVGNNVVLSVKATSAALTKLKGRKVFFSKTSAAKVTKSAGSLPALKATLSKTFKYTAGDIYTVRVGTFSMAAVGVDKISSGVTLKLPSTPIRVAYRSGNSGTTNNFTNFLNKAAGSIWTKTANDAFTSAFPGSIPSDGTFQAATGSDGVANYVRDNNGAITYTEQSYADERATASVKSALVKNNAGIYTAPTPAGTSAFYAEAAINELGAVTPDYTVPAADAYLINAIAYGLGDTRSSSDNAGVKSYFTFVLNACAPKQAAGAGYAPIAGSLLTKALAQVAKINSL